MGVRFVFGPSGSGKSTYVQNFIIEESEKNRHRNFFLIVPDQYTMQTQKEMATRHPRGGILNIDVLSFGRLKYRIFEEAGKDARIPLDDTGKCLLIRAIVSEQKENLTYLKRGISLPGYIEEIKSVISEFMQYHIKPEDVEKFIQSSPHMLTLSGKLKDIKLIYEQFLLVTKEKYLTGEESLDFLCERIPYAKSVRNSIIVFDGFTGFTPIQRRVIISLLRYAKEVLITLPFDERNRPYAIEDESFFLYLTQQTVKSIQTDAQKEGIPVLPEIMLSGEDSYRFRNNPELKFLERNLFRDTNEVYRQENRNIEIVKSGTVMEECRQAMEWICTRIAKEGYHYRDFAIITGDMNLYREPLKALFLRYHIPFFMDSTVDMLKNPFIQFLRSALSILIYNYTFRDCMAFLRYGFADFTKEEIDCLENYIRAKAVKGYYRWKLPFTSGTREINDNTELLDALNKTREEFLALFESFGDEPFTQVLPAYDWAERFYRFMTNLCLQKKLEAIAEEYKENGDMAKAKEYEQLYRYVIELLDVIAGLFGEEKITLKVFAEILEAGYGEIRIGVLPQNVDQILVGDMQRTRLKEIKCLLLLGVNDNNIPKAQAKAGLISDLERNVLKEYGMELAPSLEEQMYIQRLYLYLSVTKPTDRLYLSYASISESGEKKNPSEFIRTILKLYSQLTVQNRIGKGAYLSSEDEKEVYCNLLCKFASGIQLPDDSLKELIRLYADLTSREGDREFAETILEQAFEGYIPQKISSEVAKKLFGEVVNISVSSLEKFASCQYAHFLRYGLRLREREEAGFERRFFGLMNHDLIKWIGCAALAEGKHLNDLSDEEINRYVSAAVSQAREKDTTFFFEEGAGGDFMEAQMNRILTRTMKTFKTQLSRGQFYPEYFEIPFTQQIQMEDEQINLCLNGRIDRIDLCENGEDCYVKIVDYKSYSSDFHAELFELGVQLQLLVYMKQAMDKIKKENPDKNVMPAAMLYYHVSNPFLRICEEMTKEQIEEERLKSLNHTGIVTNRASVVELMDGVCTKKSSVIPITKKEDGSADSKSAVSPQEFLELLSEADDKVKRLALDIYDGKIEINPISDAAHDSCAYCEFKQACPFDDKIKGYQKRRTGSASPEKNEE